MDWMCFAGQFDGFGLADDDLFHEFTPFPLKIDKELAFQPRTIDLQQDHCSGQRLKVELLQKDSVAMKYPQVARKQSHYQRSCFFALLH